MTMMMNNKTNISSRLLLILLVNTCAIQNLFAQEKVKDVNAYLYNEVYKNIAAYNIRYCSFHFNGISFDSNFRSNSDFFYNYFLPDWGYKLEMSISRIDSVYPVDNFHLYKVILKNSFSFVNEIEKLERGSLGPISSNLFLLALNEDNGEIKFISGQYFKSAISGDFKLIDKDPNTFIRYLILRAFAVSPKNISFWRKKRKAFYFTGYSDKYSKDIIIRVAKTDLDNIQIIVHNKVKYKY